ncbi:MAG: hypothetical protein ABI615_10760 [Chthoniobacterales bacterium]
MKQNILALLIIASVLTGCEKPQSIAMRSSDELSAKVLGMKNYSVKLTPPKGTILLLRQVETLDGKEVQNSQTIVCNNGEKLKLELLYYDPADFIFTSESNPNHGVHIKSQLTRITSTGSMSSPGSTWKTPDDMLNWSWSAAEIPGGMRFTFMGPNKEKIQLDYTASVENMEFAKKNFPDLINDPVSGTLVIMRKGSSNKPLSPVNK